MVSYVTRFPRAFADHVREFLLKPTVAQSKKTADSGRGENGPVVGHDRVMLMAVRNLVMELRLSPAAETEIITIWLLWVTS